jgi:hypothetical protein
MFALEVQNMLNLHAVSNPMAYGFNKAKRTATAASFIAYSGTHPSGKKTPQRPRTSRSNANGVASLSTRH